MSDDILVVGQWVVRGPVLASDQVVADGGVLVHDGRIAAIGPAAELRRQPHGVEVGSSQSAVIPGLVNAHHHQGLTSWQRGVPDDALEPWIVALQALPVPDPELDNLHGAVEMLASGITTVMHNHLVGLLPKDRSMIDGAGAVLDAYERSGMRVAFSLSYRDRHLLTYGDDRAFVDSLPHGPARDEAERRLAWPVADPSAYLATMAELHATRGSERCRVLLSAQNVHWCGDETLTAIGDLAQGLGTGIHLHVQETAHQLAYGLEHWGRSPLAHLHDLGLLGPHVSCAHGVWLDHGDIELLAESGTVVCHNPSSNLRLRSGVADVPALLGAGATVALGLDQAGLDEDQDLLREMRLALRLHAGTGMVATGPTTADVFAMGTTAGAAATGFADIGRLEVGGPADIVVIDLERLSRPFLHPDVHPLDALVFKARAGDVRSVLVAGQLVVDDGRVLTIDVEELDAQVAEWAASSLQGADARRAAADAELVEHVRAWFGAGLPLHT